jgi:hypothetical protein
MTSPWGMKISYDLSLKAKRYTLMRNKLNYIFNLCLAFATKAPTLCFLAIRCFKLFEAYQTGDWLMCLKEVLYIGTVFKKEALSKINKKKK